MKTFTKFILLMLVLLAAAAPAFAQDPVPTPSADDVNRIAKNLYCPVCENVPLDTCGTAACQQWRAEIHDKLSQGWSEQDIYDYFVLKFGDRVLAEPPRRGFNWLFYIVSPLALLAGVYILWRGVREWRMPLEEPQAAVLSAKENAAGKKEYVSRMEEELRKRQSGK